MPEYRLTPEAVDPSSPPVPDFPGALPDLGRRHKIGGEPDGLYPEEWPLCPQCGRKMSFYGQLDSLSDETMIADAGLIHVFLCFDCFASASLVSTG